MDRLLKNDTEEANVQLATVGESITFLNFLYPERLLLPNGVTIATLLQTLQKQGLYGGTEYPKWACYPRLSRDKMVSPEKEFEIFLNSVCTAVQDVCKMVLL
jgi:hypothetical protein